MSQQLKETIRHNILSSASQVFAHYGFHQSTMANIAKTAQLSVGNLYRYYPSKDAILAALLPERTVMDIRTMIIARLQWLSAQGSPDPYLGSTANILAQKKAQDIVAWRSILRILLLDLSRTPWQDFFALLRKDLVQAFLVWAEKTGTNMDSSWPPRLDRFYTYLLKHIAEILADQVDEKSLENELTHVITYHVAGMYALLEKQAQGSTFT